MIGTSDSDDRQCERLTPDQPHATERWAEPQQNIQFSKPFDKFLFTDKKRVENKSGFLHNLWAVKQELT